MKIDVKLKTPHISINAYRATIDQSLTEKYKGEYEVTPKANEATVLETKGKLMIDNVTVKKVPIYETTNSQNGTTVYIASE